MPTPPDFSARNWVRNNKHVDLSDQAFEAVCNFTLMWNLFEADLCGRKAGLAAFDLLANQINNTAPFDSELFSSFVFWRDRYIEAGRTNWHFNDLKFRERQRKAFVARILLAERSLASEQFLALLIILFRLRNNLFHGEKAVGLLEGQIENLQTAAKTLSLIFTLKLNPCPSQP